MTGRHRVRMRFIAALCAQAAWIGNRCTLAPVLRLAVYTDYEYHRDGEGIFAEQAFAVFVGRLAERVEGLTLIGRLREGTGSVRYPVPAAATFVPLPFYTSLANPLRALTAMPRSLRRFWRALDEVDTVWLLGPHPLSVAFAILARLRRRRVILGVRQDMPAYVRSRRPDQRALWLAADLLERAYRLLARSCATVVVGPALMDGYRHAIRLHPMTVSLVGAADVVSEPEAAGRSYDGELAILSVGRLDAEKNPLLLADVIARLRGLDPRWRLVVCGDGPMAEDLARKVADLGLDDGVDLRGYVPFGPEMLALYRSAHLLLHVSWTEGLPQVLVEALAAGLPVVATDVGGIGDAVGDATLLIPPGDAEAAAGALTRLAEDGQLRSHLGAMGLAYARRHTAEAEADRLLAFMAAG